MTETSRKRRIDEIGDESRRRIMDAAEALFAEKGFNRTSFIDIAERSGISRGSIPWHFENKDGLLIAVVERAIERLIPPETFTSFDQAGMREVFERVKEWMNHPTAAMIYMVLNEALSADGPLHEHFVEFFRNRRKDIALLLAASSGRKNPTKADLAKFGPLASVVDGALFGLGLQHHLDPTFDFEAGFRALEAVVEAALADSA